MQRKSGRIVGLTTAAIGTVVVLFAVLVFGLTNASNSETTVDWVSVMTAIGGLVIVGRGLYGVVRKA